MDVPKNRSGTFFVQGEKIVLKKDGTWFSDGIEITHEPTREVFFKSIHWDEKEKRYCLKVGYETIFIEVEDTPFFVNAIEEEPNESFFAKLSNESRVRITPGQLKYDDNKLYLFLDSGQKAKFLSAPYYQLLQRLREDARYYFLFVDGKKVKLAKKESTKS